MNQRRFIFLTLSSFAVYAAALGACAPDSGISRNTTSSSTGSSSGNGGDGGDNLFGDGGPGAGGGDGGIDPDAACAAVKEQGQAIPLALYIAMDRSSSMVTANKWDNAKAGLGAFVSDPNSSGTAVALNFFPGANETTCSNSAYKIPVVPFGDLPGNAPSITNALNAASPDGVKTPLWPALGGAILECSDRLSNNPGTACAVLLVTDGDPVGPAASCSGQNPEDPAVIAALAATGLNNFNVMTFVIGLPGIQKTVADQIAAGGGTDSAIMVGSSNVQVEFQNALAKARGKALPCEYTLPEKVSTGEVDTKLVNVVFTPSSGGNATTILQNADCAGGAGWYYDNPSMPTKINLCPSTCSTARADYGASIDILMGCTTEVAK